MPSIDAVVQVQWSLPYFTNIPEDVVTNVTHWIYIAGPPPGTTQYAQLAVCIDDFYDDVYGAAQMGTWCNPAGATVTMYDLQQPTPRVPVHTASVGVTTTPINGTSPTESSICLSFYGDTVPGIPPARSRGRMFIGGLAQPCAAGSASSFPTITVTARNALCQAMEDLQLAAAAVGWMWVVYSPTQNAIAGQETFPVVGGWVDNTPDTQRRRGVEATARSVWP